MSNELPPQNLEAEKSVLGGVLLDPSKLDDLAGAVDGGDFYLQSFGRAFDAAARLWAAGQPVDALTVAAELVARGSSAAEVEADLRECLDAVPHAEHTPHYARMVAEAADRRRCLALAAKLVRDAHDETRSVADALAETDRGLQAITARRMGADDGALETVVPEALAALDDAERPGVATGLHDLDDVSAGGLRGGQLVVLAARPSMGKTALAGGIALAAAKAGIGVLFASLEQPKAEIVYRLLATETGIPFGAIRSRKLDDDDRERLAEAAGGLMRLTMYLDDTTPRRASEIAALARLRKRQHGIGVVVVDYLQLVAPEDRRVPREQQVAETARILKAMARQLEVPVLALAQLNRAVEARENKRPMLSDLRESGAIEQDADLVLFLDRPGQRDARADVGEAKLFVAKNRNGRTGEIPLVFQPDRMRFVSAARETAGLFP